MRRFLSWWYNNNKLTFGRVLVSTGIGACAVLSAVQLCIFLSSLGAVNWRLVAAGFVVLLSSAIIGPIILLSLYGILGVDKKNG